ncbi:D-isomer specific 2-hydroxyacid dehydrogenase [Hypoxylon sp. FL0890]|nr:D-isomer specific 2-hydroxyacid dehydrogenase [Hypoxylon sp. FL0890]
MSPAEETGEEVGPLSNDVLLVYLPLPEKPECAERLTKKFKGLQVRWVSAAKPGHALVDPEELRPDIWDGVTLLSTYMPPPAEIIPKVRFVQLPSAGVDRWPGHPKYEDEKVVFCTSNGVHAPQIAEWVIGTWLSHQHKFPHYTENMKTGLWESPFGADIQDSTRRRVGILGYGAIGRQTARLASALGMEVYAYTRTKRSTPASRVDDSYCVPGTGDPDGLLPAKWFHGPAREDVNNFLAQDLDLLVISLPLTSETRHIISAKQFEILGKKKTFIANVARGGHIDQDALLKALETGQIRGAALDVTNPEPLPSDHPLWKAPNLLITPHVSWKTDVLWERLLDVLELNLEKLATGQPLINVVNRQLHY